MLRTVFVFTAIYLASMTLGDNPFGFESLIDPLYFSLTVSSTVGFGDYSPKTPLTKLIVMVHMLSLIIDLRDFLSQFRQVPVEDAPKRKRRRGRTKTAKQE